MIFRFLFGKRRTKQLEESTKKGFEDVKKDIHAVSGWIKHLDSEKNLQQKDIDDIKESLSSINEELEGIKNVLNFMNEVKTNRVFKTPKRLSNKQTAVYAVQTPVQTGVQTPNLDSFSVTERAILWILLNTDMKLSYDDLSAMLGKERSTIRGQLNSIKQKGGEHFFEEVIEKNGKKRIYIPDEIKEKLLKKQKVSIKKRGKKARKKKA
jgi:predicted transcriptional regulator